MMETYKEKQKLMYKNSVSCSLTDEQLAIESKAGWGMFKTAAWEMNRGPLYLFTQTLSQLLQSSFIERWCLQLYTRHSKNQTIAY